MFPAHMGDSGMPDVSNIPDGLGFLGAIALAVGGVAKTWISMREKVKLKELSQHETFVAQLLKRVDDLEGTRDDYVARMTAFENEAEAREARYEELSKAHKDLEQRYTTLAQRATALDTALRRAQKRENDLEIALDRVKRREGELEQANRKLHDDLVEMRRAQTEITTK